MYSSFIHFTPTFIYPVNIYSHGLDFVQATGDTAMNKTEW